MESQSRTDSWRHYRLYDRARASWNDGFAAHKTQGPRFTLLVAFRGRIGRTATSRAESVFAQVSFFGTSRPTATGFVAPNGKPHGLQLACPPADNTRGSADARHRPDLCVPTRLPDESPCLSNPMDETKRVPAVTKPPHFGFASKFARQLLRGICATAIVGSTLLAVSTAQVTPGSVPHRSAPAPVPAPDSAPDSAPVAPPVSPLAAAAVPARSTNDVDVDYEHDVRPIFAKYCYDCHGPQKQESNLRLDIRSRAFAGGDRGSPAIVPGNSPASPLWRLVARVDPDDVMPPPEKELSLTASEVDQLRRWIDQGAPWPDELAGDKGRELTTDHWSFQPLADLSPPAVSYRLSEGDEWVRNEIDRFILQKLQQAGMQPSEPADRVAFVRRIYLDLHGLPPTASQVQAFVQDNSPDAYQRLITEVLSSTHYGQRWARHWLDVVRFGESTGFEVNRDRENAFYYRDYVIQSLNEDKSYRDFIIEQLAGDSLGVDVATGYLVAGPYDMVKSPDIHLTLMQREDELADIVNTTSTAFLGLTVGCARCHNHKFDPILQQDYYAMQAVFAGVEHGERPLRDKLRPSQATALEAKRQLLQRLELEFSRLRQQAGRRPASTRELLPSVNARLNVEQFAPVDAKYIRFAITATNGGEPCIDELEVYRAEEETSSALPRASTPADGSALNIAAASAGAIATSNGDFPNHPFHKLGHINDGRYGNEHSWIASRESGGWARIELPATARIDRIVWGRDRSEQFRDRLPIDYRIEVSVDGAAWQTVASSAHRQPFPVDGRGGAEEAFLADLAADEAPHARQLFARLTQLRNEVAAAEKAIPVGYVGSFKQPGAIHRLYRGDPLAPREEVAPDALGVIGSLGLSTGSPEQQRRREFAAWVASPDNPLTARVIVNRVWHYHFGQGIVATPSDFGRNGVAPTHPELLDWLAQEFMRHGWSLKWLHREILSSRTYQQASRPRASAIAKDANCRLLWRFPPRRLEAEAIRDCILHVSGMLNPQAGGPGFLLLRIDHENVHHYFPLEKFGPDQFRRMIYMTKIRQEQDAVFGIFDCPDGGQVIPDRSRSTTPLQALNLLNSTFMLEQANYLAERLRVEAGGAATAEAQVRYAFQLAFARPPESDELSAATELARTQGMPAFCRAILNANEFLFIP